MTNRTALSPMACTAIAAVLAAISTPAFAQDTAVPDPVPAAAPAPIVLPEFKPQPAPQPVVQPVAEASVAAEPAAAAPKPSSRTAARAAPHAAPVAAAAVAARPLANAPAADTAPAAAPLAEAQPAPMARPQAQPVAANDDNAAELGLGIVGLLALGGIGAYAASRRRRRIADDQTIYADEPLPPVKAEPAAEPVTPSFATSFAKPVVPDYVAPPQATFVPPAGAGSAAMIPPGPLPTGAALDALFERMVAAAPDADNPFKSDKRRRARVRWLMKQHEYRLNDPDGMTDADRFAAKEGDFDFRTYTRASKLPADEGAGKEVVPA